MGKLGNLGNGASLGESRLVGEHDRLDGANLDRLDYRPDLVTIAE